MNCTDNELLYRDTMDYDLFSLYSKYPSLVAKNMKCTKFSWLRRVGNISFLVHIDCPQFPSAAGARVTGDNQLLFILDTCAVNIEDKISSCSSFDQILDSVNEVLTNIEAGKGLERSEVTIETLHSVEVIIKELEKIGSNRISDVSPDFRTVTLKSPDDKNQMLTVHIPRDFPRSVLTVNHLLPGCYQPTESRSVVQVYEHWSAGLEYYAGCWSQLSELDRLCWVLDPSPVTTAHLHRRLVLTSSVSVHVELDPASPSSLPVIR